MKLTRRGFFKTLGCGVLAALVPSALLKRQANASFDTKDKVFRVTERWPQGFGLAPIKQEGAEIRPDPYLTDPGAWFLKEEDEKNIVWLDNRSIYGTMAQ